METQNKKQYCDKDYHTYQIWSNTKNRQMIIFAHAYYYIKNDINILVRLNLFNATQ